MKIQRTCMRDQVRDLVVERILDGRYPAGTRLKELALAAECNVSQAPVREALRELEALGMVQSERYRGTRVRAADIEQLREAYELRALLEERAAQLAVPCSPEVLASLRDQLQRMRRTLHRPETREHTEAAIGFHRTVVAASGNTTFLRAWDALHWEVRMRIAARRLSHWKDEAPALMDAHAAVVTALENGEGKRAGRGLREIVETVLRLIERMPEPGAAMRRRKS